MEVANLNGVPRGDDVVEAEGESTVAGYRGNVMRHHRYWFGIPYARAGRWRAPELLPFVEGQGQDATKWGNMCPQLIPVEPESSLHHLFTTREAEEGEDCLNLHIYAPRARLTNTPVPVVVFVYGGFLVQGSASMPIYDARNAVGMASYHGMHEQAIWVVPNYRHGPMGFLLREGETGNHGIEDVMTALEWIQQNIHRWGGDPNQVTLAGFSAGSCLVNWIQFLEADRKQQEGANFKPRFHRCYNSSGSAWTLPARTREEARWDTFGLAVAAGFQGEDHGEALRYLEALPWEHIHAYARQAGMERIWAPIIDGKLIRQSAEEYHRSGRIIDVPRWFVSMAHDGSAFAPPELMAKIQALPTQTNGIQSPQIIMQALQPYLKDPQVVHYLLPIYRPDRCGSLKDSVVALITDTFFTCPAQRQTWDARHTHYTEMHTSLTGMIADLTGVQYYGAFHGMDILLILGGMSDILTMGAREESKVALQRFLRFVHGHTEHIEDLELLPARCKLLSRYPRTPFRLEALGMRMPYGIGAEEDDDTVDVGAELQAALMQEASQPYDRAPLVNN